MCPGNYCDSGVGLYGYSTTLNGTLGNPSYLQNFPSWLTASGNLVGSIRFVAGCLKVNYTGSELERSGMVGLYTGSGQNFINGTAIGAGNSTQMLQTCNRVVRLGSEVHEVRWVPTSPTDLDWINVTDAGIGGYVTNTTAIGAVVVGAPAGKVSYEFTWVVEWKPRTDKNQGVSQAIQPPRSFDLNDALRRIGDVASFATRPSNIARVASFANSAFSVARSAVPLMAMA